MSADVLVDTCIWINFLRGVESPYRHEMRMILRSRRALLCGIVMAELLQGVRRRQQERKLAAALEGLPYIEMTRQIWNDAGMIGAGLRAGGHTVPVSDLAIAALALHYDVLLFSFDTHFNWIPQLRRYAG
ncbi:MAG TPA: PIN domain-containing protein [Acidobacteriota bacterium]